MPRVSKVRWHIRRDGETLTLARRLPVRFDVAVTTTLPDGARGRLAHQIRQDVWRALQDIRGFSPAVQLRRDGGVLQVTAGGDVLGKVPRAKMERLIEKLLNDPEKRLRWVQNAMHKGGS